MARDKIAEIMSDLNPAVKKELLDDLVKSLLSELIETEKKELLQKIVSGGRENQQVIDMVEH